MKILVAPLNWGLGHASRCVPLVQRLLDEGHELILGGDGESLTLLRRHFPKLRYVYLAPLSLRYGNGKRQVWAMVKALPKLVAWSIKDHTILSAVLREEHIDRVVSDNRFGLFNRSTECFYMTHQLHINLPKGWRWLEQLTEYMHARVYAHFNKVLVPDYAEKEKSLAGALSHPKKVSDKVEYIGPLSRFSITQNHYKTTIKPGKDQVKYRIVSVLSGLEPHRSLLEKEIVTRYKDSDESVLIVQGLMNRPNTRIKRGKITMTPSMGDEELAEALLGAEHIIARSGYSTVMDLSALGLLNKAELIPTPGQPEQEYLANWINRT